MRRLIFAISFILVLFSTNPAYSFWIWSPKNGSWTNPKHAVRPTPAEQFDFAKTLYDGRDYKLAKREFEQLVKHYPKSVEAAEAQYYIGLIEEAQDNLYEAYLAYQKVIDKYPFSERIQEIIEKEFKVAEEFMAGKTRRAFGINLPVENPAIEIFRKVIENSFYGPLAAPAQYKLALVLKGLGRYFEAEEEFQKVISNYPNSEWVDAAKFQIASTKAAISKSPDYDQEAASEAKKKFEDFIREHPDAALSHEAEANIDQLKDKEAEADFNSARFYEKQKQFEAARIYYEGIIEKYPKSIWSARSLDRLEVMEKKK